MKKKEVIVLGAGAVGRGFLPWKFLDHYDFVFIDTSPAVITRMRTAGSYHTFRVRDHKIEKLTVPVTAAYLTTEFEPKKHPDVAAVFVCVGPRNVIEAVKGLETLGAPLILCENDRTKVDALRLSGEFENVCFAVPDVITSNTAPPKFLAEDPLSVISEDGELFIEKLSGVELNGAFSWCTAAEMDQQWLAKLYLHNTPHCIAAYLGSLVNADYIHEAMDIPMVHDLVCASMQEMLATLKLEWPVFKKEFLDWYAEKEISRFCDKLLYDPIARVAREPLRKLERDGRLIGAAQLCLSHAVIPRGTLTGIVSAMLFDKRNDPDSHISFMKRSLSPSAFLSYVLGLRKGEVLELVLARQLSEIIKFLSDLQERNLVKRDGRPGAEQWR